MVADPLCLRAYIDFRAKGFPVLGLIHLPDVEISWQVGSTGTKQTEELILYPFEKTVLVHS